MITQRLVDSRQAAHAAAIDLYKEARRGTERGHRYLMQLVKVDPNARHQLRKLFHGPILRDVSEQVWVEDPVTGKKYRNSPELWKLFFATLFIEPEFKVEKVDGRRRVVQCRPSTEGLTDAQFALFTLQSIVFSVCELRVTFTEEGAQP